MLANQPTRTWHHDPKVDTGFNKLQQKSEYKNLIYFSDSLSIITN
jgi:hypothetical protein